MVLLDVNVLVYAYRKDATDHAAYARWLRDLVGGEDLFLLPALVLSGVVRVLTHPAIFAEPTPIREALNFADYLHRIPTRLPAEPGPRHWEIFIRLCREAGAKGNLVPDAYLAALALESGSEMITADRGFARFPGLKWRHPLDRAR